MHIAGLRIGERVVGRWCLVGYKWRWGVAWFSNGKQANAGVVRFELYSRILMVDIARNAWLNVDQ